MVAMQRRVQAVRKTQHGSNKMGEAAMLSLVDFGSKLRFYLR